MRLRRLSVGICAALALASATAHAEPPPAAQPAAPAARTDDAGWGIGLANSLMSPYCPGRTLPDCPSSQAAELRHWIVEQEQLGRDRKDVEAQLIAQYGEMILQAPRARGFGVAAYVIPVAAFLAGGALVVFFLRRQQGRIAAAPRPPPAPLDPELERMIDRELARERETPRD